MGLVMINEHIMKKMFTLFMNNRIDYCVFKSTMNLRLSFCARNDFDILLDKKDYRKAVNIFKLLEIKRFETPLINNYSYVENWIAFDSVSGYIYHIHLHMQLITGTAHVKEYRICWEEDLIHNAVLDKEYNLIKVDNTWELLLLISRIVLKEGDRGLKKAKHSEFRIDNDMLDELLYLIDRVDVDNFLKTANRVYSDKTVRYLFEVIENKEISATLFAKLFESISNERTIKKEKNDFNVFLISKLQNVVSVYGNWNKSRGGFYVFKKRKRGLIIAFVGADGSGKTKTVKEVYKWLNYKIEAQSVYLGAGDGQRPIIKRIKRYVDKNKEYVKGNVGGLNNVILYLIINHIEDCIKLYVSFSNRIKVCRMRNYKKRGGICVADRYPQLEQHGINDGLKIDNTSAISRLEKWNLSIVKQIKPDVIFRLNVTEKTSCKRKSENRRNVEGIKQKIKGILKLKFEGARIIEIDTEQTYKDELIQIKKEIWKLL